MRKTFLLWLAVIAIQAFSLFWWNRWIFTSSFDRINLTDLYDHSQWSIPQSPRIMADAELYQLSGDLIVRTGEFFRINPETPPFGKWLYGLSIAVTQNAYWGALAGLVVATILTGAISRFLFSYNKGLTASAITISLLLGNSLFSSQLHQTMLDIPQLIGLLLFLFGLMLWRNKEHPSKIALSALGLGIFMGSKIAVFTPLILVPGLFFLPLRRWKLWIALLAGAATFYIALYLPYFLQGNSLFDWLRTQKWMLHFYTSSGVAPHAPNLPAVLFTGWHWGWWSESWSAVTEWNVLWPILYLGPLWQWRKWRELSPDWRGLLTLHTLLLAVFLFIPFWPRYLLLLAPVGALFLTQTCLLWEKRAQWLAASGIVLLSISSHIPLALPLAQHLGDRWSAQAYPEIYNLLEAQQKSQIDQSGFVYELASVEHAMQSQKITSLALLDQRNLWLPQQTGTLTLARETPLGTFIHTQPLTLQRENGRWRILWDWQLAAPHYEPGSTLTLITEELPLGTVRTSDGVDIIAPGTREVLFVDPTQIPHDENSIKQLEAITGLRGVDLRTKIFVTSYGIAGVRIGPSLMDISQEDEETLKAQPGYLWSEEPTLTYNSELRGVEYRPWLDRFVATHPELLSRPAGTLQLRTPNNKTFILQETDGEPAQNLELTETLEQLKTRMVKELL